MHDEPGSVPATVVRLVRLGFEVRVDAIADGQEVWVQITRGEADRLDLAPGSEVYLRPVADRAAVAFAALTADNSDRIGQAFPGTRLVVERIGDKPDQSGQELTGPTPGAPNVDCPGHP